MITTQKSVSHRIDKVQNEESKYFRIHDITVVHVGAGGVEQEWRAVV